MSSAYDVHSEFGSFLSPDSHRKAGLALAFILFGSIGGASGVVVQMVHEPSAARRSVVAATPLNPSATLSTIVASASPAVSAPDNRQDFTSPSDSTQTALVDAIATSVRAPATTATGELPQQPVAASKKPQKTARSHDRRWYDAYALRQQRADYGRGPGYSRDFARPIW